MIIAAVLSSYTECVEQGLAQIRHIDDMLKRAVRFLERWNECVF